VMQAIARGTSDEVLRQVDHLISEGHSPTHFARQMVRFLRNATFAKIAGKDSSLLQISSDERERVARVAELFGEEDLTRHLQIMLRTHGELGYKQEQRFHLELGLLKMAHAQRLLPIEQLLSEVAGSASTAGGAGNIPKSFARPSIVAPASGGAGEARRTEAAPVVRPNHVSPFAADSARKGGPRQESAAETVPAGVPRMVATGSMQTRVIMGAAAPADLRENAADIHLTSRAEPQEQAAPQVSPAAVQTAEVTSPPSAAPIDRLQSAVLQALTDGNQRILVSMLEAGEWGVEGSEVVIKVSESQTVVDMSLSADARRLAIASASGALGRPVKLKIIPGATVAPATGKRNGTDRVNGMAPGPGGRSRAEQDLVVRRLQEKFGAEIRTVIDYKEKR
jgi:DNA polymerase-3 subunit gamma/tau